MHDVIMLYSLLVIQVCCTMWAYRWLSSPFGQPVSKNIVHYDKCMWYSTVLYSICLFICLSLTVCHSTQCNDKSKLAYKLRSIMTKRWSHTQWVDCTSLAQCYNHHPFLSLYRLSITRSSCWECIWRNHFCLNSYRKVLSCTCCVSLSPDHHWPSSSPWKFLLTWHFQESMLTQNTCRLL